MTRLLVSVRDAEEADVALRAGAHWIDVKEPRRGSLGPADPAAIFAVDSLVAGRVPVSAALGELVEQPLPEMMARSQGVRYVKLGMAGCADVAHWEKRWARVVDSLRRITTPIAVSYADWRRAGAPRPSRVLKFAVQLHCGGMLIDTHDKSRGGLLDHTRPEELSALVTACRSHGMTTVLAGSLTHDSIRRVLPLNADYVAVRGAACVGSRQSRIDGRRVGDLVRLVRYDRASPPK